MFPQCLSNLYNQWFGPFFDNADFHKIKLKITQPIIIKITQVLENTKKKVCLPLII